MEGMEEGDWVWGSRACLAGAVGELLKAEELEGGGKEMVETRWWLEVNGVVQMVAVWRNWAQVWRCSPEAQEQ